MGIWKKIGLFVMLLLFVALLVFARIQSKKQTVQQVEIQILPENEVFFVRKSEVSERLTSTMGKALKGAKIETIDFYKLEMALKRSPWIEKADVYADHSGTVHVRIEQRIPLLRLIPDGKKGYYLDQFGRVMPLSPNFAARVPIASGSFDTSMHSILYTFGRYVYESKAWKGQIQQIFVQNKNNLILSPAVGNFTIEFGSTDRLEEKFECLKAFYGEVIPKVGWDHYQEISVRYKGQVIGRRL